MDSDQAASSVWLNRPIAQHHETTWSRPIPASNPKVTGLPLVIGAKLLGASDIVKAFLWRNAGFGALREHPALSHVEPRYEPTVIKSTVEQIASKSQHNLQASDAALLKEDWSAKRRAGSVYHSVLDYHEAYLAGKLTPSAVVEALLPLVRRDVANASPHSIAFFESRVDLITAAAQASTERYKKGKPLSPMDGVPMAIKDEADLTGYGKCYGTTMDFKDKNDVTGRHAQRWLDAGAILIGRTSMHEMGMDTTNNNPNWGTPVNPHNERYYTGGSSGGSAYSVAAGLTPFSMGNDGGGSIRIPSNYCGLYGLKPSHGRVSTRPSANLAKSTAVAGPLAASMVDLEIAWRVVAQPDAHDPDSRLFLAPRSVPLPSPTAGSSVSTIKPRPLGIYRPWFDLADDSVRTRCDEALSHLTRASGGRYELVDISLPLLSEGQLAHATTILNEALSALKPDQVHALTPANRILLGIGAQSSATVLLQAQKVRHVLMQHLTALYDARPDLIIVTPTTPNAGWFFAPGDLTHGVTDANTQLRNMTYVWLANFVGCPAISCPVGYVEPAPAAGAKGAVPVGLMGMAEWAGEEALLELGYDLEQYLIDVYPGGKKKPGTFVDVFELARAHD